MKTIAALVCGGLGLCVAMGARATDCRLERVADLPIELHGNTLLIKAKMEGQDVSLLVDTASPISAISARTVERLKLHPLTSNGGYMLDGAGMALRQYVTIKDLNLSGMNAQNTAFVVMGEANGSTANIDGIFGADFLSEFDLELDLSHSRIALFTHNHCSGQVVYWTQEYVDVPFELDASMHPLIDVTLDGQTLRALINTGAGETSISTQSARHRFGIDPESNNVKPDTEITTGGGIALPIWRHRFSDLQISDVDFRNPLLVLVPDNLTRIVRENTTRGTPPSELNIVAPITIGIQQLSKIRAVIAYSERRLYISAADAK